MRKLFLLIPLVLGACHSSRPTAHDSIIVGLSDPPTTLDPRRAADANSMRICDLIFQGLVKVGEDLQLEPDAALKWSIESSKIVFTLKPHLVFQNGDDVTVEDVVDSFHEYMKKGSSYTENLANVAQVRSEKPDKIIFDLKRKDAALLSTLVALKILPHRELSKNQFDRNPVGSGPFAFKSWTTNELTLQRTVPTSGVKNIVFKFVRDENTRYLKIIKGELDVLINELQEEKIAEARKSKTVNVLVTPGLNFNYVLLNLRDPVFKSEKVRRALLSALDRESIVKYKLEGLAEVATSLLAPVNPFSAFHLQDDLKLFTLDAAKKIVMEAGLAQKDIVLKTSEQALDNGRILTEQWNSTLGLRIRHQSYEWATFFGDIKASRFQMALMRWVGLYDPDIYRDTLSTTQFAPLGHNRGFYSDAHFDSLVEAGREEMDFNKRKTLYTKAQQMIVNDLPVLPLWYNSNISVLSSRLKNFKPIVTGSFLPLVTTEKE